MAKISVMLVAILMAHSGVIRADQIPAGVSEAVLEAAKNKQKTEYESCKKSYDYWAKEVGRLSAPHRKTDSVLIDRAKAKAKELADKGKHLVSDEYLTSLIREEAANEKVRQGLDENYTKSIQKDIAAKQAEEARIKAAAEAAELARQQELARIAEAERLERERREEAARLEREREKAQRLADKQTWGLITLDKYDRLITGITLDEAKAILGTATFEGASEYLGAAVSRFSWRSTDGAFLVTCSFNGANELVVKNITPLQKMETKPREYYESKD